MINKRNSTTRSIYGLTLFSHLSGQIISAHADRLFVGLTVIFYLAVERKLGDVMT